MSPRVRGARRRVVGLGLCVLDHLYRVDRFDPRATRTRYRERRVCAGGMVANALAEAARLGCEAHLLSVIGDDPEGRILARELARAGVGTRRLVRSPRLPTTVAVVISGVGERRFLVPDRRALEARAPALDLSIIGPGTLLLVDGHFPAQALRAVRRARRLGAVVIGDFHRADAAARALLPFVDHPIVPEEFAQAFAGGPRATLRALRDRYGGSPVVTLGARGGLYLDGGRVRRYRAQRVAVHDTTGAGDAFHGAFAAGLSRGLPLAAAIDLAARAAARACSVLGGQRPLSTAGAASRPGRSGRS